HSARGAKVLGPCGRRAMPRPGLHNRCAGAARGRASGRGTAPPVGPTGRATAASGLQVKPVGALPNSFTQSPGGIRMTDGMPAAGAASTRAGRVAALAAGAWDCIAPPHDADEILLKVQAYVRAKLDADRARSEGLLDPLSGLYNRQGLARRARELGSQAFREHGALACVAVALDLEQGEAAVAAEETDGAAVARCVNALKSSARLSDVVGRLSATEFAVLAPDTDAAGARRLAERRAPSTHT